ncbi:MAG TPA: FKBP-type peptidyl-prolyl cis-trans isomerase [Actinospica sp.]|nr:FKBP-type peptidyl-prolyl cis-trans isomerase [Actinospica sp.]
MQLPGVSRRGRLSRLCAGALAASAAGALLAACGGGATPQSLPTVSGAVGEQAAITIPAGMDAPTTVESDVLVQGSGAQLKAGDAVVVNYTLMNWTGGKLIGSTYSTDKSPNKTQEFVLGGTSALASWNQVLPGITAGSRVEIVTPPSGAFGANGATAYGITGKDDLIYVLDVVAAYPGTADITGTMTPQTDATLPKVTGNPGTAPTVTLPASGAPGALTSRVLIPGSGAQIQTDQRLMVQYVGVDWNTGKQFDSSFADKQLASFVFGSSSVISGWNTGLAGKHVGDRVLLVVPAAEAYGTKGVPSAGIRGGDTLVFVVDIVDALS